MITGDNALTASHVAGQVAIVQRPVLIGDGGEDGLEWKSVDEAVSITLDLSCDVPSDLTVGDYDLCLTGRGLDLVIGTKLWDAYLLARVWIYARVSPTQKELILTEYKLAGYTTLMCGDGTNDVGALKQAHVGIALLDGNEEDIEKLAMKARIERQQKILDQQAALKARWGVKDPEPGASSIMDKRKQREDEMKAKMASMLEEIGDDVPVLKFGDASVAAPFTSKISSISSGMLHLS
jgi:cation-transporting ATPase 13A1